MDPVVGQDTGENTLRLLAMLCGKKTNLTGRTWVQSQQSTQTAGQDPRGPPDSSRFEKTVVGAGEGSVDKGTCLQSLAT